MKRATVVGAFACLLVSNLAVAEADPFCDQLNAILAAAGGELASLKGEAKKDEPKLWAATKTIRGSSECLIVGDSPSYTCTLYSGDKDESAREAYRDNVEWVGKCLGGSWKGKEQADAERTEHTFTRGAGDPTVRIRSQAGDADAYTVEIWVDPPQG